MKKTINKFFSLLGYKVVKLPQMKPQVKPGDGNSYKVVSALDHNTSENMNNFFKNKEFAEKYISGRQAFYQLLSDKIINSIKPHSKILKVCDVGCGPGDLLGILQNSLTSKYGIVVNATGFDHSDEVLRIGGERFPTIEFQKFNLFEDHTQFKENFDVVICSEVIEHLLIPKHAVRNLISMVKPEGLLFLTVPEGRKDNYLGHINFWSPESWEQFVKECLEGLNNRSYKIDKIVTEKNEYNYADVYAL